MAPLFLMCDPRDLVAVPQVKNPLTGRPTVFLCDNYPAGVGLAPKLYESHSQILEAARAALVACACAAGCPSCVGPPGEAGAEAKTNALTLIDSALTQGVQGGLRAQAGGPLLPAGGRSTPPLPEAGAREAGGGAGG